METSKRKKIFILWISVSSIALVILFVWFFNIKKELIQMKEQKNDSDTQEVNELKDQFTDFFKTVKEESKKVKESIPTEPITNTEEDINKEVKDEASSTKDVIDISNNCPAYINCMPMIGETSVGRCNIPLGCENITIPVY